jgi:CRISPR-associated protein Csm2
MVSGNNKVDGNSNERTFKKLAEGVKGSVFKDNFDEILKMSKTDKLDNLLNSIEEFAGRPKESQKLGACVTTSQLRNVYDKAKKATEPNGLKLIRPNLAYIAGRDKGIEVQKFLAFLDLLIQEVKNHDQLKEFKTFFEAVVAYHKFYGKQ